jgi:hypothetical protein
MTFTTDFAKAFRLKEETKQEWDRRLRRLDNVINRMSLVVALILFSLMLFY